MKTKKQQITKAVLNEAGRLASEPLTAKQLDTLREFTEERLDTHGKYGYMFQTVAYYKRQLVPVGDIKGIATYILENNFIKTI